jgi:hypothetical protein
MDDVNTAKIHCTIVESKPSINKYVIILLFEHN